MSIIAFSASNTVTETTAVVLCTYIMKQLMSGLRQIQYSGVFSPSMLLVSGPGAWSTSDISLS